MVTVYVCMFSMTHVFWLHYTRVQLLYISGCEVGIVYIVTR